jgi:hypothetical protein
MSELVFKRKFRWTLEGKLPGGDLKPQFVKVGERPRIEETQIEPNTWITAKHKWQSINVTIWEASWSLCGESPGEFWTIVYPSVFGSVQPKLGTFKLTLYDSFGVPLEEWELENAYINKVDFAELDHSSSDESVVDIQIHYENSKRKVLFDFSIFSKIPSMGCSQGKKTTCPKCEHEFFI